MRVGMPIILLLMAAFITGCSTAAKPDGDVTPAEVEDASDTATDPEGRTFGYDESGDLTSEGLPGDAGGEGGQASFQELLAQRSIYFDYDSNAISLDYRRVIEAHARFLSENSDIVISIEGHADERGSREYNLALGERRALAVSRMLSLLGLQENRINTLSFGEEKPYAQGSDEESWRLNRRVDLVY